MVQVDEAELLAIIKRNLAVAGRYRRQKDTTKEGEALKQDPVFSLFGLTGQEYILAKARGAQVVSLHRKLGDLYQELVSFLFQSALQLSAEEIKFELVRGRSSGAGKRSLDAKIPFDGLNAEVAARLKALSAKVVAANPKKYPNMPARGLGFEVRFCYQIGDSKRINADIENADASLAMGYLPVMLIFCSISLHDPIDRFRSRSKWFVLEGMPSYDFLRELTSFDLFGFLQDRSDLIRTWIGQAFGMT